METTKKLEFPKEFKDLIGQEVTLKVEKKGVIELKKVKVLGLRWSAAFIMNSKTMEKFNGIEILIRAFDGKRNVWTRPFNSNIPLSDPSTTTL
jgi:hypothetical protein